MLLLFLSPMVAAQSVFCDFESDVNDPILMNLYLTDDSTAYSGSRISRCSPDVLYGLGFRKTFDSSLGADNIEFSLRAMIRFADTIPSGKLVISTKSSDANLLWMGVELSHLVDSAAHWTPLELSLCIPNDYLVGSRLVVYLFNEKKRCIDIDDFEVSLRPFALPSYLPSFTVASVPDSYSVLYSNEYYSLCYAKSSQSLFLADTAGFALTKPLAMTLEHIDGSDTLVTSLSQWRWESALYGPEQSLLHFSVDDGVAHSSVRLWTGHDAANLRIHAVTTFHDTVVLARQAIVVPFVDTVAVVWRRNQKIDTCNMQSAYYLDREGVAFGNDGRRVSLYHPDKVSSLQLDVSNNALVVNADYWADHPLIHYPLSDDTLNYFVDVSCSIIESGHVIESDFVINVGGAPMSIPRFMPVANGYESAIVFTEHADWTDIRTHRAVCYGDERVATPRDAVGGFVYYGIPVTKSVFYNNPDHYDNAETSLGLFTAMHASIKETPQFYRFLKQLHRQGFEICLHTPEQRTSRGDNMKESLAFMKRHFGSPSWIDHGYNNSAEHNRENLVCDGLDAESRCYSVALWRDNDVRYLWNPYYEENRFLRFEFDANLLQPYHGFGDAIPNRQITAAPQHPDLVLWATPSTLEVHHDSQWDYYYSDTRLQKIIDYHAVFITHIYPAWTNTIKGFWQLSSDSLVVAMPGLNRTLKKLDDLRRQKKILPATLRDIVDYQQKILNVEYRFLDEHSVQLTNKGAEIRGLSMLSERPAFIDHKFVEYRRVGEEYLFWFDLEADETIIIHIR